jgi:hypothetical protein
MNLNREQTAARNSALKVLSYAMNNLHGRENCELFVEILGLAVLFPLFMKPDKKDKKKSESSNNEGLLLIKQQNGYCKFLKSVLNFYSS